MNPEFKEKILRNCALKPITPLRCGKRICRGSHSYTLVRDFWLLHFVLSGKGKFTNRSATRDVGENEMFIIRPNELCSYRADADEPWTYIWIGFYSDLPIPIPLMTNDVIRAPYLRDLFLSAFDHSQQYPRETSSSYEYFLCGSMWQIFGLLTGNYSADANTAEVCATAAINIIKCEYHTRLNVSDIASRLHLTRTYFSEMFKARVGMSPKKYLNTVRMEKAAELLTEHNIRITDTATSVGFSDVFSFSRAFKAYHKCSPTHYISMHSKK